jgi:hypothetical protein
MQGWDGAPHEVEPVAIGGQAMNQGFADPARCARHDYSPRAFGACADGHQIDDTRSALNGPS